MSDLLSAIEELEALTAEAQYERIKQDPYYFLTRFCYTLDEHDPQNPHKLIPKKEYIRDVCDVFQIESLIAIEKSRQMLVSWVLMALGLWYTMFKDGCRTFIMSKKEKDANAMIDRIKIIYERLPDDLKNRHPADEFKYLQLSWAKNNSIIQGVPQGPDQVRQYTSSLIISDETAFQEKAEKAWAAARPSLMGGGKYVTISTPNGKEFFYRTVSDLF
jgi:phage FluMu gp28-like protein